MVRPNTIRDVGNDQPTNIGPTGYTLFTRCFGQFGIVRLMVATRPINSRKGHSIMATTKGPLFSEQAEGTIGETLRYSLPNGFQRVQAKKLKYNQISHRYFDNQFLIQWAAGLTRQYPAQIASIYKPLAITAGLPVQAFLRNRLKQCLQLTLPLKLPDNTVGTNIGTGSWPAKVLLTKTRLIVCPPAFPSGDYDGWVITINTSTVNALNRVQVAGYSSGGTWSTTEWWKGFQFRVSVLAMKSQIGTVQGNRIYTIIST